MSPPKADPARHDHEATLIVRAAFRLIGRSDDGWCSVQDILGEANLSTRAFYRHFRSKDDLILAMYRDAYLRLVRELDEVTAAAPGPLAAFEAWVDRYLAVVYEPRRAARSSVLNSAEARSAKGFDAVHAESVRRLRAGLAAILERGRVEGVFRFIEPIADARAVHSVLAGLIDERLRSIEAPTHREARDHTLRLFLRAFSVEDPV